MRPLLRMTLLAIALALPALAQNVKEPELINVPHWLDSANDALKPVERIAARFRSSGLVRPTLWVELHGEQSSFRLAAGQRLEFAVSLASIDDPEKLLLYKLKPKKGKREAELIKLNLASGVVSVDAARPNLIPCQISKLGNSFKLTPKDALPPGEYAFIYDEEKNFAAPRDAFCFGVDATK